VTILELMGQPNVFPIRGDQAAKSLPGRNNQQTGDPSWKGCRGLPVAGHFPNLLIFLPPLRIDMLTLAGAHICNEKHKKLLIL